jgi:hypothetical protein
MLLKSSRRPTCITLLLRRHRRLVAAVERTVSNWFVVIMNDPFLALWVLLCSQYSGHYYYLAFLVLNQSFSKETHKAYKPFSLRCFIGESEKSSLPPSTH